MILFFQRFPPVQIFPILKKYEHNIESYNQNYTVEESV